MSLQRSIRCARRRQKSWGCKDIISHDWLSGWMGLRAKEHRWPLEAGKGKETEAVHLQKGCSNADIFILVH